MRTLLLVFCMVLVAGPAAAISRYNSTRLTCARVHAIIRSEAAAIMRYPSKFNPGNVLYDRYVRNGTFCAASTEAHLTTIPTADRPNCPVYECRQVMDDDNWWRRHN